MYLFCENLLELKASFKKVVVGLVGMLVLAIGVALLVLPGPAFLVIPAGLAILATEFEWAERWKQKVLFWFQHAREKHRRKREARQTHSVQ